MTAPYYADDLVTLYHGDCLDVLRELPDASVDAVVTDPPYGLEFMGKEWDAPWKPAGAVIHDPATERGGFQDGNGGNPYSRSRIEYGRGGEASVGFQQWCEQWATECLRVLKPGGHMLAFGGTRTWHRLACAVEDAGFEVRDSIAWLYGSGFPKSLDVSKAIDKAAGAEREVVGPAPFAGRRIGGFGQGEGKGSEVLGAYGPPPESVTAPATDDARRWQGWGTALKPAFEPVVVARKPLTGTVAQNVLAHGTGALNIDGCRIASQDTTTAPQRPRLDAWESEANRCDSCAEDVAATPRRTTPATEASTATSSAGQLTSARGASTPAATPRTDTGCSDGTTAGATSTSSSTVPSGSSTTAPYLTDSSSTTSTTTDSTTGSRTCNSCGVEITSHTTPASLTSTPTDPAARPTTSASTAGVSAGRWPSNVVLDESQAAELDRQSGVSASRIGRPRGASAGDGWGMTATGAEYDDEGGASRFFYVAKAPTAERPRVKADAPQEAVNERSPRCAKCGLQRVNVGDSICKCAEPEWVKETRDYIAHPTVKPLDLMRWLVRLVTPPGGVVLEPFAGSGTTAEACVIEGFRCIAIEREDDYLPLIVQRLTKPIQPDLFGGVA